MLIILLIDNQDIVLIDLGKTNIDLSMPVVLGSSYVSEDDFEETASNKGNDIPTNDFYDFEDSVIVNPYTKSTDNPHHSLQNPILQGRLLA